MKAITAFFAVCASVAMAADVTEVRVKAMDGFGGDTGAVSSRCQTKAGAAYDPVTLTRDVNSLKDSGEFEDVAVDAAKSGEGIVVTFFVKRKLRYCAPLVIKGGEWFSESKIASESGLKDGGLYGEGDFAAAAGKIRELYHKKHFPDVKVTPIPELTGGNNCTLTLLIDEGARQKLRDYVFAGGEGAEGIDEGDLRAAIGDYPWWNPVGWFNESPVTDEQLAQTVAKIEEFYRNAGYLDVKVAKPERVPAEDGECDVKFAIESGTRYRVGKTSIEGLTKYPEAAVAEKSALPAAGAIAGEKDLQDAAHRIMVAVGSGDSGLADTKVDYRRIPSAEGKDVLDIVFRVKEGVPVVLNEIVIRGNDYTMDKVIRREIALGPGDRMLEDRAERSQKRLENLDYFGRVRYYLEPTDLGKDKNGAEYRNLVYEVEEKNTGSFMVGVGASSVDSVYVSAELSQSNFDLFAPGKLFRGAGQKGRIYAQAGPRIQSYEASVTEPHLFGRLLELTVEGYRRQRWYDDYDIIRTGAGASLSYPVKFWPTWEPFGRFGMRLSGEYIEFDDVDDDQLEYKGREVSLKEEERKYGDAWEPVVRFYWSHDTRDNFRTPKSGHRTQLFFDIAPAGDNQFYRTGFNHRSYFNVWKRYGHVLMAGFRAETIDGISDEVPIYNRMFLGGPKSIRGIEYRNVTPFAKKVDHNDYVPWGGQTLVCANFEYTIPIVKMLRLAAFTDLGSIGADEFDSDLSDTFAWTVGLGIRLDIPMFPIRLDFGTPIERPSHADKETFSFTVGYDF